MTPVEILQFSLGGGFWRFLGCWLLIATVAAAFSNAVTLLVGAIRR